MGDFYWTGIEICAEFGPVGITEKKLGPIMSNFLGQFFQVFMGKKLAFQDPPSLKFHNRTDINPQY